MSEKIFKNRITQETPNTIKQLKSLWIDMSSDKQLTPNTPNGLFAFTLNPNNFVDAVKLETDFKSILSHYYHWRYGSKWRKLKHIQVPFQGIIEKQSNGINHIHITIYQYNVEELALFIGYIIKMFKSLYFKASYKIKGKRFTILMVGITISLHFLQIRTNSSVSIELKFLLISAQICLIHNYLLPTDKYNYHKQGDLMNNNKKNQYLEMFLNIADELLENHHIKSRRDFSSRYLNKCSNYLGSLVWQNKKPSISSSWALLVNLNRKKQLPHWQKELSKTLYNMALKD